MIGFQLFKIGSFSISTHGAAIAVAFLLGMLLSRRQAKRLGIDPDLVSDFMIYAMLAGVLGARLWDVAFTWQNYADHPLNVLAIWNGGLSIQGGILGGILVGIWFAKKKQISVWQFADIIAPGLILGMGIGRIGDFLAGDDYGIVSQTFGFVYQQPGTFSYQVNGPVPLVPTVLYEALGDFLILMYLLMRKRKVDTGSMFLLTLIWYSVVRFILEFLRGDSLYTFFGLRTAQVTSVLTIAICVLILSRIKKKAGVEERVGV